MTDSRPIVSPTALNSELKIRIKTYDIDYIGHVNNAVYMNWLEDLRLQLFDTHFPIHDLEDTNVGLMIVNTDIHYKQGIYLKDKFVDALLWIDSFDRATCHIIAEFSVDGQVRCTATQRGAFVDSKTHRIVRVPQGFRDILEG